MDENQDNMVNFKDFVRIFGVMCKADYTQKLKLLYMLHQAPALLENDDFDLDELASPSSGLYRVIWQSGWDEIIWVDTS